MVKKSEENGKAELWYFICLSLFKYTVLIVILFTVKLFSLSVVQVV